MGNNISKYTKRTNKVKEMLSGLDPKKIVAGRTDLKNKINLLKNCMSQDHCEFSGITERPDTKLSDGLRKMCMSSDP